MLSLNLIFIALPVIHALAVQKRHALDHSTNVPMSLSSEAWFHPKDHPVHALFKRVQDDAPETVSYAAVGSPAWSAGFPPPGLTLPDPSTLPTAWVNALNAVVAAGKIPNIPVSTNTPANLPVYPDGLSPASPQICSGTYKCRIPGDIWDSPDGVFASAFDDGPTPFTPTLVQFLQSNNVTTTHFMIGSQILYYPAQFLVAFQADHDIGVHTWTHPYMTTKDNLDVVGELGWAMQLIANSTGGRLPKYWRPPYGDTDVRVSAIAREVFSLQTVAWNQDTADYAQNMTAPIVNALQQSCTGPKSPGLIVLEHEISEVTVEGFMLSYNTIVSNGWNFQSLAQILGGGHSYSNAQNSSSNDVIQEPIVSSVSSTSASTSSLAATPTAEASMNNITTSSSSPHQDSSAANLWTSYPSTMLLLGTLFNLVIFLCL